jgi:hypothetical protein
MQPIPNHSCSHVGCSSMPMTHVTCEVQESTQHAAPPPTTAAAMWNVPACRCLM